MADEFYKSARSLTSPLTKAEEMDPSSEEAFTTITRAITIGTGGDLTCRFLDDTEDVTISDLSAGFYPFRLSHVRDTGTTAAGIVGFS